MRSKPWSAQPRLRELPRRIRRNESIKNIISRCSVLPSGCLLYPVVRDFGFPYIDIINDNKQREQWSARRLMWVLENGSIPDGGILIRGCVPKNCITPVHQLLWVPDSATGDGNG